jgi:bifunctional DNA-binding transcriptional regulator/antitoxin component of YhaV-PrlF toxin-antitoxin module
MTATTMTLTVKRQTVFPLEWCKRNGLAHGGPVNVFETPDGALLIRPVRPPTPEEYEEV